MPLALLALALLLAWPAQAGPSIPYQVVVLQGLDKVTARVSELEVPVGGDLAFGTLTIQASACVETPPTEPPESAAFLHISAADHGRDESLAFSGWMFASSPAVSALEHPVYDVWVIDCREPVVPETVAEAPLEPEEGEAPNVSVPRPSAPQDITGILQVRPVPKPRLN